MMNYAYPLPEYHISNDACSDQALLDTEGGAAVLVSIGEEYYLALAGGGMDLSWDICLAYMLLGYLPPVHFCGLPGFAGKKLDAKAQWVIDGCRESCRLAAMWAQQKIKKLDRLQEEMKGN